jgi:hypothetical protein
MEGPARVLRSLLLCAADHAFHAPLPQARRARFQEEGSPLSPSRSSASGLDSPERPGVPSVSVSAIRPLSPGRAGGGAGGGAGGVPNLLDLDDIFGAAPMPAPAPATAVTLNGGGLGLGLGGPGPMPVPSGADLLGDMLGPSPGRQPPPPSPGQALADMLGVSGGGGGGGTMPMTMTMPMPPVPGTGVMPVMPGVQPPTGGVPPGVGGVRPTLTAFEKDGLVITMELSKPDPADPQASHLLCRFANRGASALSGLLFQCAVPKYVRLEMTPATGTALPPGAATVEQLVKVHNSMLGQKTLQVRGRGRRGGDTKWWMCIEGICRQ